MHTFGDKYKVAKRWGRIYVVNRKWFHQSVARKACLSEESYPVQGMFASSLGSLKTMEQHSQVSVVRNSHHTSSIATASESDAIFSAQDMEPDHEIPLPDICPSVFEVPQLPKEEEDPPADERKHDSDFSRCVADDSQCEGDDLYLSECRILLVGFEPSELRKLVEMVRKGGGSRYMSFNQKLTHIIVGNPSKNEIKEVRSHTAAVGVVYTVKTTWLEECTFKKKEVPVLQSHIAYDSLLPKDPINLNRKPATSMSVSKQGKSSIPQTMDNVLGAKDSQFEVSSDLTQEANLKVQSGLSKGIRHIKSSTVFKGKLFRFSSSFPQEQHLEYAPAIKPEIVLWINEGGGEVVEDQQKNVHFIVERHGAVSSLTSTVRSTYVTTHWVHSCLEDGCLLDVSSQILYHPLPCQIPLPGFEGYRICVSRYDTKERHLLRNLCYVLGARTTEKLTKKVTHLLCKFADGEKYEAAYKCGIHVVTAEWMYECATQNKVVDLERFRPKELTSQDRREGLYSVSQYPIQCAKMTSDISQESSPLQDLRNMQTIASTMGCMERDEENYSSIGSKRARVSGNDSIKCPQSCESTIDVDNSLNMKNTTEYNATENIGEVPVVPDVAAAIEDLLEQTSKIQDRKSQGTSGHHENSIPGPSKHWLNRIEKRDDYPSAEGAPTNPYDGFSETQTDSQVVGYEEDLTGRQMIIDRVRTLGSRT
ncbi:hypothetical protein OROHE_008659 [Orobanche hederae]